MVACVLDVVKNITVKVFNLISRTNEARHLFWNKTCKCKYRLDASVCNNKQRWSKDKCKCECKELIGKGRCDKEFIWNPSICHCECDKSCDIRQYLGHENCKCRGDLISRLVEECSENIDDNEMIDNAALNNDKKVCDSCTINVVLLAIAFLIIIGSSSSYLYFNWYLKKIILMLILIPILKQQFIKHK